MQTSHDAIHLHGSVMEGNVTALLALLAELSPAEARTKLEEVDGVSYPYYHTYGPTQKEVLSLCSTAIEACI